MKSLLTSFLALLSFAILFTASPASAGTLPTSYFVCTFNGTLTTQTDLLKTKTKAVTTDSILLEYAQENSLPLNNLVLVMEVNVNGFAIFVANKNTKESLTSIAGGSIQPFLKQVGNVADLKGYGDGGIDPVVVGSSSVSLDGHVKISGTTNLARKVSNAVVKVEFVDDTPLPNVLKGAFVSGAKFTPAP